MQNSWMPIEKTKVDIKLKLSKSSSPIFKRIQYPLMLAWSCTVHKVQGLSLDKIVPSLDLLRQRNFTYGQIYVPLNRVTSFNGPYIVGIFSGKVIRENPRPLQEYEMRLESYLSIKHADDPQNQLLKMILLNAIQDWAFWTCQKAPLPSLLKSVTHILHWWNLAKLYLT